MLTWWLIDRYPDYEIKQSQNKVEQKNTIHSSDKLVLAEACDDILNDPMLIKPTDNLTNKNNSKTNAVPGQSGSVLKTKEAHFSDDLDYKEILEDQLENEFAFTPVELPGQVT